MKMLAQHLGLEAFGETIGIYFFVGCLAIVTVIGLALFFFGNFVRSYKK